MSKVIPILRFYDEEKTKQFFVDFLEFQIDWEHRYEPDFPLYMQLSKDGAVLHLSEHHGDCTPGSAVRIEVEDAKSYQQELLAKAFKYARPGYDSEWNQVSVTDPAGNKLHFYTKREK